MDFMNLQSRFEEMGRVYQFFYLDSRKIKRHTFAISDHRSGLRHRASLRLRAYHFSSMALLPRLRRFLSIIRTSKRLHSTFRPQLMQNIPKSVCRKEQSTFFANPDLPLSLPRSMRHFLYSPRGPRLQICCFGPDVWLGVTDSSSTSYLSPLVFKNPPNFREMAAQCASNANITAYNERNQARKLLFLQAVNL